MKTDAVGTVRCNRKEFLKEVTNTKLQKGEVIAAFQKKLMALKWRDRRDVYMLSSIHDARMKPVKDTKGGMKMKPEVCIYYSDAMGGADLSDQYMISYSVARKRMKKYYQKIFRHLLNLCVFNSYVIHKKYGGNHKNLTFRMEVINSIIAKYGASSKDEH